MPLRTCALVLCVTLIAYLTTIMAENQGEMSLFSNSTFASNVYDILKKTPGNVFFSPYSLQVALAMTYAGATGNTAKQLQEQAYFTENKDATYKAVRETTAALKSGKDVTLNVANGVFVQEAYDMKPAFGQTLKDVFEAESKELNFAKNVEAANVINSYVSKNTNGKIPELFTADAFTPLTRLVLVNAIYFKGSWLNKFDPNNTHKGDFFLNSKDKVEVDYMTITKKFVTVEHTDLKSTIVELPYAGGINMVLVVPNEIEGLKHVESTIKNMDLTTLTNLGDNREVTLTMPKFKLEQTIDLIDPLKELGIVDMFDAVKADFGGITDKRDLFVSKAVQKAFIEVNEEGSEAAASTAIKFVMRMMPVPPMEVHVKGPFLFFIRHENGPLLFAGRVSKP